MINRRLFTGFGIASLLSFFGYKKLSGNQQRQTFSSIEDAANSISGNISYSENSKDDCIEAAENTNDQTYEEGPCKKLRMAADLHYEIVDKFYKAWQKAQGVQTEMEMDLYQCEMITNSSNPPEGDFDDFYEDFYVDP